jgi:hypothetical protein
VGAQQQVSEWEGTHPKTPRGTSGQCILAECHSVPAIAAYLLESLESLVPGCEVPPQEQTPLSWKDVKRLIRLAYCKPLPVARPALLLQTVFVHDISLAYSF